MATKNKKHLIPLLMGFLIISIACSTAYPFLERSSTKEPISDSKALETMIAEAIVEKVAQTLEAIPATITPTAPPSETPLPTETPLPSPTATEPPPSATPTSGSYPTSGDDLKRGEDGNYIYLDYTGAYLVNIPEGWLPIRPESEEYDSAWLLPEASSPEIRNTLESMQSLDQNIFRIFILDIQEGHYDEGIISNINFMLDYQSHASLEEIFAQNVLDLPKSIPGLIVISSNIIETSSGIPYGTIASEWGADDGTGATINIYQEQALFSINDKVLIITFTSSANFKDQILSDFETLVNDIEILQ